jgi:alpha-L-rhamnosidase
VLPLYFGLVPQDEQRRVFNHLVSKINDETHGHIGTGLIGGQYLNRVLSDRGRADLSYTMAGQKDYPSWGYMVGQGATTIWELWNGDTADPAMNSGNHVMLVGDLVIWLNEYVAGIRPDEDGGLGFKRIVMRPHPVGDLTFVEGSLRSPHGLIASNWRKKGGVFDWQVTVSANTTATVYVPAASVHKITEGGIQVVEAEGVKFVRMDDGYAVLDVGSGKYHFLSK